MNAGKERGKFSLVVSVQLLPYDFLIYSDTSNLRAAEVSDLAVLVMGYLEDLLGMPVTKRLMRRYGGKILEWLESVAAIYEQESNETNQSAARIP